jgi:hypothetical protein
MINNIQELIAFFAEPSANGGSTKINIDHNCLVPMTKYSITPQTIPKDLELPQGVVKIYIYSLFRIQYKTDGDITDLLLVIQDSTKKRTRFSRHIDYNEFLDIRSFLQDKCGAIAEHIAQDELKEFRFDALSPESFNPLSSSGWDKLSQYNDDIQSNYDDLHKQLASQFAHLLSEHDRAIEKPRLNLVVMGCGFGKESIICAQKALKLGFHVNLLLSDYSEENVRIAKEMVGEKFRGRKNIHIILHQSDINNIHEILSITYAPYLSKPGHVNILISSGAFSFQIMLAESQRRTLQILQALYRNTIHHILAIGLTSPLFHSDMERLGFYQMTHLENANKGGSHLIQLDRVAMPEPILHNDGILDLSAQPIERVLSSLQEAPILSRDKIHTVSLSFCDLHEDNISTVINFLRPFQNLRSIILDCGFELMTEIRRKLAFIPQVSVVILRKNESVLHAFFGVEDFNNTFEPTLGEKKRAPLYEQLFKKTPPLSLQQPAAEAPLGNSQSPMNVARDTTLKEVCAQLNLTEQEISDFEKALCLLGLRAKDALSYSAKIDDVSKDGCTVLMAAARMNIPRLTAYLIENGADVHVTTEHGHDALMFSLRGSLENTKMLLAKGVNVNAASNSVLLSAVKEGDLERVKLLIEYGADLEKPDDDYHLTAIGHAVRQNPPNLEMIYCLVLAGAELDKPGKKMLDCLSVCSSVGEIQEVIQQALDKRMRDTPVSIMPQLLQEIIREYASPIAPEPKPKTVLPIGMFAPSKAGKVELGQSKGCALM